MRRGRLGGEIGEKNHIGPFFAGIIKRLHQLCNHFLNVINILQRMKLTGFAKDSQIKAILGKTFIALLMFFLYKMLQILDTERKF